MSSGLASTVLSILKSCHPDRQKISLHEPSFQGRENEYIKECIDTGWVSSVGKFVDRFEQQLADSIGAKRAIAVVNGTAALHICLRLVGVEQDDEVLIPALTFVATANAVSYCGAIPHFVDSEESTLGLDPRKLASYLDSIAEVKTTGCFNIKTGRRIKAVIPVHTFGHPVDMDPLVELCDRYCLALVEDAAESLGSLYKGRHTGNWGKVSALSFNGNKIITTGGGGAILTNDDSLADKAKHLTTTARVPHRWEIDHDMVGYNYRLPNLNAALGCAQLDQLPAFVQKKRALATRYQQAFQGVKGMRFFAESDFAQSNYWLNVLLLDDDHTGDRDKIIERTNSNGIMTRPAWRLMHELPMYSSMPRMDLAVAEELEKRIINIPSSSFLV
jgi:perosamine synthetase